MDENITALYTNLYDANNAMCDLKTNGIRMACINTSEFGLHIGINQKHTVRKFPGAIVSTIVKLEIKVGADNRDSALSVLEGSFCVID
ncbi:MAG TPA: hypothetical protein VIK78_06775 [Ruminiclostridium sp.]